MANLYPNQSRAIDPYSSYYSDNVNKIHQIISHGENCILGNPHYLETTVDSTSPLDTIIVSTGFFIKDNVLIELTSDTTINCTNPDYYLTHTTWTSTGYYYLVLQYTYEKARPAPKARFYILKPGERTLYSQDSEYLFVKCINVTFDGTTFVINSLHDFDPSIPTNRRQYSPLFAGVEDTLPTFNSALHEARIIYNRETDTLWWGTSSRWEEFSSIRDVVTTLGCTVGQLVYVTSAGVCQPAIANSNTTLADAVCLQVGSREDGSGQVRLYGVVDDVPVESGREIQAGEQCYLSETTPGAVTDLQPSNFPQFVGTSITDSTGIGTITLWFQPGSTSNGNGGSSWYDKYQDLLNTSIFTRLTTDTFVNVEYIDQVNTTATLDTTNYEIDGDNGDVFQTNNLTDNDATYGYDGSCITSCQLSYSGTVKAVQTWYVNNHGDTTGEWEPITENEIHYFSTTILQISDSTGAFTVGEIITGQTSGTTAIVNQDNSTNLLLRDLTGAQAFTVGETITGSTSGSISTAGSSTSRTNGYTDLRLKCEFSGTGTITDYGLLYELNSELVEAPGSTTSLDVDTLFSDVYTAPSRDGDGIANLVVPIETCKNNLQTFVGSTGDSDTTPDYAYAANITQGTPLESAIDELDLEAYAQDLFDIYGDLLNNSYFERVSYDGFIDASLIDGSTTATRDTANLTIVGTVGQIFVSADLYDSGAGLTYIDKCQVSANVDAGDYTWYVSNDGGNLWEPTTLNTVHTFSTVSLPVTDSTGTFTVGEVVTGGTSGTAGTIVVDNGTELLLRDLTGSQTFDSTSFEVITGASSGASAVVSGDQTNRTSTSYRDLRVYCLFGAAGGTINHYGVIYDIDEAIVTYIPENANNIIQLAADLYTSPSLDNDGLANLTTPLETCKTNLQTFTGSVGDTDTTPPYSSTNIITTGDSLTGSISDLDSSISLARIKRNVTTGDTTPSILNTLGKQCGILIIDNTSATTITDLDDAISEAIVVLLFSDSNTILQHNSGMNLLGNVDFTPLSGDSITLVYDSDNARWTEIARQSKSSYSGYGTLEDSATPDISEYNYYFTDATASTSITGFTGMDEGKEVTIIFKSDSLDVINSATMHLDGNVSFSPTINSSITLVYLNSEWYQK